MVSQLSNIPIKTLNGLYVFAFCVFAVLIVLREFERYAGLFGFLPVLGGSIPYAILTLSLIFIYRYNGRNLLLVIPKISILKDKHIYFLY